MPSPTPHCLVQTERVKRPPGRPVKRIHQRQELKATVSPATMNRLIDEACAAPGFEGEDRSVVADWVKTRLAPLIEKYPWWYGSTDSRHRTAQKAYAYERQQAGVRDIAAKERVRRYEIGYQARKKGYKARHVDGATYVAFEPAALDANRGEEIAISVEEQPVSV